MTQPKFVARIESEDPTLRFALLIDADNAQAAVIDNLLAEIARYGEAIVKRIYGDFTSNRSASWKNVLQKYAIKPVQQFAYSVGKNATDSALIIDAMDLMYTKKFDGFCLMTSDSDFTGLATRIREEGLLVYGFGEQKTPEAFRNVCHKFLFTEVFRPVKEHQPEAADTVEISESLKSTPESAKPKLPKFPTRLVIDALEQSGDDSGWSNLGTFGSYLTKLLPEFDSRNYGFKKLSELVKAKTNLFETEEKDFSGSKQLYVRAKKTAQNPGHRK